MAVTQKSRRASGQTNGGRRAKAASKTATASEFRGPELPPLSTAAPPAGLPTHIAAYIGERPLLRGEDPAKYDMLFDALVEGLKPVDAVDYILVKETADAIWQARRLRRVSDRVFDIDRRRALIKTVKLLLQENPLDTAIAKGSHAAQLVTRWLAMGSDGEAGIDSFLAEFGLDESIIATDTYLTKFDTLAKVSREAAAIDARRTGLLSQIEQRRARRPDRFGAPPDIVEAEAEEIVGSGSGDAPEVGAADGNDDATQDRS